MRTGAAAPRGRMPEKRRAIADAARVVFGREGYARASVDVIAAEAGVSKRTLYNHFHDKEQLFLTVALEASTELSQTIARIADRHLRKILDLEEDLIAFGFDRAVAIVSAGDHFALVRTINAEAAHMSPDVLHALEEAGPRASHRDIAGYLRQIADRGLLTVDDVDLVTTHFTLLTFTNIAIRSYWGAMPIAESEIEDTVTSGVRAFLRLYGPVANLPPARR